MKYFLLLFSVVFLFNFTTLAQQDTNTSYEIGIALGGSSFQTDFGENGDFKSNVYGNIGMSVSGLFFLNFANLRSTENHWFKNHSKLKAEVSYIKANINHFGIYAENEQFKAMHATSSIFNLGVHYEYYFFNLSEFNPKSINIFSPYIGVGTMVNFSKPTVESDINSLPSVYLAENSINTDSETTFSLVYSLGTRIKINHKSDLIIDTRWNQFFSDYIDGLKPQIEANNHNDWMYSASLGYVIYLD